MHSAEPYRVRMQSSRTTERRVVSLQHLLSRARRLVYKFSQDGLAKIMTGIYVMHASIRTLRRRRLAVVANAWPSFLPYGSVRLRCLAHCSP